MAADTSDTPTTKTTDIVTDLRKEMDHLVMKFSGSGEVERTLLERAANEIDRLRARVEELEDAAADYGEAHREMMDRMA
jgi:BMFP domain-containing protein YqiC